MIRIRFSLVFIFLWIGLTACEHKDLCYDHPHFATVRVIFDWTKISNHDKPEGMRKVCQNAHLHYFTYKAPTFTSWGFVIT